MSVMLEKIPGCHLISKLCSILLMEKDFDCANKIIYGTCMLNNARKQGFMPDKIFTKQNQTLEEGLLTKVLFYNLVHQSIRVDYWQASLWWTRTTAMIKSHTRLAIQSFVPLELPKRQPM
jgi:hypothetical protein